MSNVVDINRKAKQESGGSSDEVVFRFEDIRVTKGQAVKYALATAAVTAIAAAAVIGIGISQNDGAPSVDEIKNLTPTTQPAGYDPDKANPSGIDHS